MAGTLGDAAAFSFYPTKNLGAFGDAGAVLCQDAKIAERVRELRQYGWKEKYRTVIPGGRNSRMDPIQGIVLTLSLKHLARWNVQRRQICAVYASRLPHGWSLVYRDDKRFVGASCGGDCAQRRGPRARHTGKSDRARRALSCSRLWPGDDCGRGNSCGEARSRRGSSACPELSVDELEQVLHALHTIASKKRPPSVVLSHRVGRPVACRPSGEKQ